MTTLQRILMEARKKKIKPTDITSDTDLIKGVVNAVSEAFKLYSYITFAEALINKGLVKDHVLEIDVEQISKDFLDIDRRTQNLKSLTDTDLYLEALEISEIVESKSELLYNEVMRAEPIALIVEEQVTMLSKESDFAADEEMARKHVFQTFAWKRLNKIVNSLNTVEEPENV
jgi:hypothetical protein